MATPTVSIGAPGAVRPFRRSSTSESRRTSISGEAEGYVRVSVRMRPLGEADVRGVYVDCENGIIIAEDKQDKSVVPVSRSKPCKRKVKKKKK